MARYVFAEGIKYLKGVGPARADALAQVGIKTCRDLLHFYPRRHLDHTNVSRVIDLKSRGGDRNDYRDRCWLQR